MASVICSHSLRKASWPCGESSSWYVDVFAKSTQTIAQMRGSPGREQPVGADPDERNRRFDAAQPRRLPAIPTDVVEIHRARQVEIAVGVEPLREGVAVVMEVALDVERRAERRVEHGAGGRDCDRSAGPCSPSSGTSPCRPCGQWPDPRDGKTPSAGVCAAAPIGIGHDRAAADLVHSDALGVERAGGGDGNDAGDELRMPGRPLQRLEPADRATDGDQLARRRVARRARAAC